MSHVFVKVYSLVFCFILMCLYLFTQTAQSVSDPARILLLKKKWAQCKWLETSQITKFAAALSEHTPLLLVLLLAYKNTRRKKEYDGVNLNFHKKLHQ